MKAKPVLLNMLDESVQPEVTIMFKQLKLKSNRFTVNCEFDQESESPRLSVSLLQNQDNRIWEIQFEQLLNPKFLPPITVTLTLEDLICEDTDERNEKIAERLIANSATFETEEELDALPGKEDYFEVFLKIDGRDRLSQIVTLSSIPNGFIKNSDSNS